MNTQHLQARADEFSSIRRQIERASQTTEQLAASAIRRRNETEKAHAFDLFDALTEIASSLTRLMRQTADEIQTHNTTKEHPQ